MTPEDAKKILGIEKIEDAKRAFFEKARKLHPDKGGDTEKFREIHEAYELLKKDKEEETSLEEYGEWMGWIGRWAKRMIHINDEPEKLRLKIPWKLLEDRGQILKIEYDSIPVMISLQKTETISVGGLKIQLIPNAQIYWIENGEKIIQNIDTPWFKENEWLYETPPNTEGFRIDGGEWSTKRGIYGRGIRWI
jgi:hypothetical protein